MENWLSFIWVATSLVLLVFATRWFGERLRRLIVLTTNNPTAALWVYFLLFLPGTLVHEVSHWLMAKMLGVRTAGMTLRPQLKTRGQVRFGSVKHAESDFVRSSLIGMAPLIAGTLLVLGISNWRLSLGATLEWTLSSLTTYISQALAARDAWLWIYLILSISNSMLPSKSDQHAWKPFGLLVAGIVGLILLTGLAARIPEQVIAWLIRLCDSLSFAFSLTVILDLVAGVVFYALEMLLQLILGREVVRAQR